MQKTESTALVCSGSLNAVRLVNLFNRLSQCCPPALGHGGPLTAGGSISVLKYSHHFKAIDVKVKKITFPDPLGWMGV